MATSNVEEKVTKHYTLTFLHAYPTNLTCHAAYPEPQPPNFTTLLRSCIRDSLLFHLSDREDWSGLSSGLPNSNSRLSLFKSHRRGLFSISFLPILCSLLLLFLPLLFSLLLFLLPLLFIFLRLFLILLLLPMPLLGLRFRLSGMIRFILLLFPMFLVVGNQTHDTPYSTPDDSHSCNRRENIRRKDTNSHNGDGIEEIRGCGVTDRHGRIGGNFQFSKFCRRFREDGVVLFLRDFFAAEVQGGGFAAMMERVGSGVPLRHDFSDLDFFLRSEAWILQILLLGRPEGLERFESFSVLDGKIGDLIGDIFDVARVGIPAPEFPCADSCVGDDMTLRETLSGGHNFRNLLRGKGEDLTRISGSQFSNRMAEERTSACFSHEGGVSIFFAGEGCAVDELRQGCSKEQ